MWLPLRMNDVPSDLRALGWVGFRAHLEDSAWKKPPYQIGYPSRLAANNNPEHWRNEGDVREVLALAPELFDGFGIALTAEAGITLIDVDDVRDPETGELDDWAREFVETFDTWGEISVSGRGIHLFARGRLPGSGVVGYLDGLAGQKVEAYSAGRFAYLTGHALEPVRPLADRQRHVTILAQYVRPAGTQTTTSATPRGETPIPEGARNDRLFRIARGFVLHGLRGRDLQQALQAVNRRRCVPPLPAGEVVQIARNAEQLPDRRPA
jgi:putative DNA primase/helicase